MQVRSFRGEVVARAGCGLAWWETLADLDRARFPMLGGIDPYGDTVFNQRQVPVLLEESERLPEGCRGQWVDEARDLGKIVLRRPHRYLWFIGD